MPQLLGCLCQNNLVGCDACTVRVRPHFIALAEQTPGASPGQLIEQAIARGLPELVLAVLQNTELDINQPCCPQRYNSASPFLAALRASNARIVALIAAQPKFDLAQSMPEYECWDWVRTASLEVLQLFLSIPGSDVNQSDGNGKTLLAEVVYDLDSQDKLRWLLSQPGIVIDNKQVDDTTPLYRAGLVGNLSAFELLLARGADVNNRNNDNRWTVLMCAVADDRVAIVERLLRHRELEIGAADDRQRTALHLAAGRGHTRIVELLLQHPNIQVNLKNSDGRTPLSEAAFAGHVELVRRLLERPELEVNFVDQDRQTPLFHAASTGKLETVRLLLADGRTNVAISNRPARHTPLNMAVALGFTAIAKAVGEHAGDIDELSPDDPYVERDVEPPPAAPLRPWRK